MRSRGQIIPRGENRWLVRVFAGRDGNGKRKYVSKTVEGTYKQAEKELTAMQGESDSGALVVPSKQTVKDYLVLWLKGKQNIATKTRIEYEHRLAKDVYPFVGGLKLHQLTKPRVKALYGSLISDRQVSAATVRHTHAVLRQAMADAVEDGLISRNPCEGATKNVLPKRQRSSEPPVLQVAEVNTLLAKTANEPLHALWRLVLTTGLRPQEALALQWADVEGNPKDDAGGTVKITKALHQVDAKGRFEVAPYLKTASSWRTVSISAATLRALLAHKARQAVEIMQAGADYHRQGYVFANSRGNPLDISFVRRRWKAALKAAELPERKLYATRHTHLSHLLAAGANPKAVADRGGHADPTMLLRVYAHTLDGADVALAAAQEALLTPAKEA